MRRRCANCKYFNPIKSLDKDEKEKHAERLRLAGFGDTKYWGICMMDGKYVRRDWFCNSWKKRGLRIKRRRRIKNEKMENSA